MVLLATGLRLPALSRRTRATFAPFGASKRTEIPVRRICLTRTRDTTRSRLTASTRDFARGACATIGGAGAVTTAGAVGAGAVVPLPVSETTWLLAAVL